MTTKTCRETRTIQTHIVMPPDINAHKTLFGGRLMEYLDIVASISVRRFCHKSCVTASMDQLNFIAPFPQTDTVCLESYVTGTGHRSLEVFCKVIGEDFRTGERYLGATAFLTFAILGEKGTDYEFPTIVPETDEEKMVCGGYEERRAARVKVRKHYKEFNAGISIDKPW